MLTALPDSWAFSPHMLPSQRCRAGFQDSRDWRSPCTPALLYFPTSSKNVVKLLTAPTQVTRERSDNSAKTKGAEEYFPGHSDVRTAEVVTEFTENSTRQLTESQNQLNGLRTNSWFWLPSNFQAGGLSDGTELMGGSDFHWIRKRKQTPLASPKLAALRWKGCTSCFLQRLAILSCTRPHVITINDRWYSEDDGCVLLTCSQLPDTEIC